MAGLFDDVTAARSNVLNRLSAGEPVDPAEREQLDQISASQQGEFRKGLRRAAYNASATTDAFIGGMAEPFAPNFADRQFAKAENTIRNQPRNLQPEVDSFRKVNDLGSAVSYASGALGEATTSIGGMVAAGLASRLGLGSALRLGQTGKNIAQYGGSMAAMLPQEGGETALTLRQNPEAMDNTTPAERAALTLGRGGVNAALESIVPNLLLTNTIAGTARRIAPGARPALSNIGRKAAAGAVGEAGTEGAQELTGQLAENIAAPGTGYDTERVMESAVRGAIAGTGIGAAGGTIQAVRSNIDAAADTVRGAEAPAQDALNRTVEGIDNIIRNPEQAGIDLTDATMGALAEAQARAGALGEQVGDRAGPAAASGMEAIAGMRAKFDRAVREKLTPENRQKYNQLTKNFRLMQPSEYSRLKDALETGDATTINQAIGDVAAQFYERVPRETLEGLQNVTDWAKRFGNGVTQAAREGRKAAQKYDPNDIRRFRSFLNEQYPNVLRTMDSTDVSERLSRLLMAYRDDAQLLNAGLRPNDQAAMEYFEKETGVPLQDLLVDARNFANENVTRREKEAAFETSTGDSQISRVAGDMERLLTDDLREEYEASGIQIGPGATEGEAGTIRDAEGNVMDVENPSNTPFNSFPLVRKVTAATNQRANPAYSIEATMTSDQLTPEQIGILVGSKTSNKVDGQWVQEVGELTDEQIAARVGEDGFRTTFNTVDIAGQAGTPSERGGARENFEAFVPDFEGNSRDLGIQGYRLMSAIAALDTNGIELQRSDIPAETLQRMGLDPEGDPIRIKVNLPVDAISEDTVVQRKNGRAITLGDLTGATRTARALPRQLELLESLGDNPNGELQKLKQQTGRAGKTADALSKGLYNFALKQEPGLQGMRAVEKRNRINSYAAAYAEQLRERITDTERNARERRNIDRLRNGLRDGIFAPEDVREYIYVLERAYSPADREAYAAEQDELDAATTVEEMENVESSDVDPDRLATDDEALAWADGLELEYSTTDDLVEVLTRFESEDLEQYSLQQAMFDQEPLTQEPTADDEFAASRRSPEGAESVLRQRGIDRQNDAAERAAREQAQQEFITRGMQEEARAVTEDNETMRREMDRESQRTVQETRAQKVIRERREQLAAQAQTPPVTEPAAADEGDGTLRKAKGKAADRETIEILMSDESTRARPIAGEFTLFGETFVVHKSANDKGWSVAHKGTAVGIGVENRRSISGAAEDGVTRLREVGRDGVLKAIAAARAKQQPTAPAAAQTPAAEETPATETTQQRIERVQAERKAANQQRSVVRNQRTDAPQQPTTPAATRRPDETNAQFVQRMKAEQQPATTPAAPVEMTAERREELAASIATVNDLDTLDALQTRLTSRATETLTMGDAEFINGLLEQRRAELTTKPLGAYAQRLVDGTEFVGDRTMRATTVRNWAKKYLGGMDVRVAIFDPQDADVQGYFGGEPPLGRALPANHFAPDTPAMILLSKNTSDRAGTRYGLMHTLAHEFGHIIEQHAFQNAPTEVQAALDGAYSRLVEQVAQGGAVDEAMFNAGSVMRFVRDKDKASVLEGDAPYNENAQRIAEGIEARIARGDQKYILSKPEFFAEQFAKYAMNDPNIFAGESQSVRDYLDRILAGVKKFYREVIQQLDKVAPEFETYLQWLGTPVAERPPLPDFTPTAPAETAPVETAPVDERNPPPIEGTVARTPPRDPPQEPPPPPQGPQDPPSAPPPPPDNEARARFIATVKRLLGNRVNVEFDATTLPDDVAAEYQSSLGQSLEDTAKALKAVREQRRDVLKEAKRVEALLRDPNNKIPIDELPDPARLREQVRSFEEREQAYLADLAVRGTIRVAAGMEAQAGLAEHEAFHAAFEIFFGQDNAADRKAITTAFTRGVLANRLQKYFAGNDDVLAVIDPANVETFSAEEAAAYAFQVFLHEPGALQMGEKVEGIFNRFLAYLQKLVGYQTYEERAKAIFNDLNSGRRAERGVSVLRNRGSMETSMLERSQDFARGVGTGFMHLYDTVLSSTYSRLENSGNVAMAQIARLGYNETGQRGQGMIQLQRLATTKYGNRLKEALHTFDQGQLDQLNRAMILGDELDGRLGEAQAKLRKLLAEVHQYQREAGVDIGFREDYYPMIWNPDKVAANAEGFVKMLTEKYPAEVAEMNKTPDEVLDSILAYEELGGEFQGIFNKDGEPTADSARKRSLDFIAREDRVDYMEDDLVVTMAHYINQSVRHTEFVRAYGENGSRLKALMGEITGTYGGTQTDVALAKDYIDGLMGDKEIGMSRELKDLYGAATVYQNVRLLPLSVFSSLVDPLGIAVRTQSMAGAFDTFAYSIRNMFTDFRNQKDWQPGWEEKYAEDVGTIDMSGTVKSIDKIYTGVTLRGKTREINDTFFKWNLLNGWVKNNHIMATKYAQLYLRRNAEGMFGEKMSAENLQEVGLRPEEIVYDETLGRIRTFSHEFLGYESAAEMEQQATAEEIAGAREQADRIQQALHKIVRQSLIQPSSAEMPGWMSNPYLAPIAHLKTFVFGFNATIMQRLLHEARRGNYSPIYYAAAYVPGMIAADFIKGFAGNGGEEPEWKKNWTMGDYVEYGVERSGLLGTGQFFSDVSNDVTRGGGGWETLSGPTIEQATDLIGAMNAKTSEPTRTWVVGALPVNALYDQWVMP